LNWYQLFCLSRYNLLRDDDPEEFVTVEIPSEVDMSTSTTPVKTKKNRFLTNLIQNRHSSPKFPKRQRSPGDSDASSDFVTSTENQVCTVRSVLYMSIQCTYTCLLLSMRFNIDTMDSILVLVLKQVLAVGLFALHSLVPKLKV